MKGGRRGIDSSSTARPPRAARDADGKTTGVRWRVEFALLAMITKVKSLVFYS